jgi:dual specificity tyrosine-phosphorylation-regulated kinase 2/3/4
MDPPTALTYYCKSLNTYEQSEIINYETIYFFNINHPAKEPSESEEANNFGFDNDKNEYISEVGQHIAYQYEI